MKEKLRQIMIKGGFSVLIAVAAMAAYLFVMYLANNYFNKVTEPLKITVNDRGELSLNFEKEEDEIIYILWETDAGNIKAVEENELFSEQYKIKNNRWYYVNTSLNENIIWDNKDADGYEYSTATIKAVIYSYNKEDKKDQYYMGNYVNEITITVTLNDGKVVKSEDERYFSNPIRKDEKNDWSQIYLISEDESGLQTYRYRTGKKIEEEVLILCWESDNNILSETDYKSGLYPKCKILEENKDKTNLLAKTTITIDKNSSIDKKISAYLIDESSYDNYDEGIEEKSKLFKADFIIK